MRRLRATSLLHHAEAITLGFVICGVPIVGLGGSWELGWYLRLGKWGWCPGLVLSALILKFDFPLMRSVSLAHNARRFPISLHVALEQRTWSQWIGWFVALWWLLHFLLMLIIANHFEGEVA